MSPVVPPHQRRVQHGQQVQVAVARRTSCCCPDGSTFQGVARVKLDLLIDDLRLLEILPVRARPQFPPVPPLVLSLDGRLAELVMWAYSLDTSGEDGRPRRRRRPRARGGPRSTSGRSSTGPPNRMPPGNVLPAKIGLEDRRESGSAGTKAFFVGVSIRKASLRPVLIPRRA